jgi:hypothetical protein
VKVLIDLPTQYKTAFRQGIFNAHSISETAAVVHVFNACLSIRDLDDLIKCIEETKVRIMRKGLQP